MKHRILPLFLLSLAAILAYLFFTGDTAPRPVAVEEASSATQVEEPKSQDSKASDLKEAEPDPQIAEVPAESNEGEFSPEMAHLVRGIQAGQPVRIRVGETERRFLFRGQRVTSENFQVSTGPDAEFPASFAVFEGRQLHSSGSFAERASLAVVNGAVSVAMDTEEGSVLVETNEAGDLVARLLKSNDPELGIGHAECEHSHGLAGVQLLSEVAAPEMHAAISVGGETEPEESEPVAAGAWADHNYYRNGAQYDASLKDMNVLMISGSTQTGNGSTANLSSRAATYLTYVAKTADTYENQVGLRYLLQELILIANDSGQPDIEVASIDATPQLNAVTDWAAAHRPQGTYRWGHVAGWTDVSSEGGSTRGWAWISTYGSSSFGTSVQERGLDWRIHQHELGHGVGANHTSGGTMNSNVSNAGQDFFTENNTDGGGFTAAKEVYDYMSVPSRSFVSGPAPLRHHLEMPFAADDDISTAINTPVVFNPLSNDSNATPLFGLPNNLRLVEVSQIFPKAAGAATISGNEITFTPATGFTGEVWFRYTLGGDVGNEGKGWLHAADVVVTVGGDSTQPSQNPALSTTDDVVATDFSGDIRINPLLNDEGAGRLWAGGVDVRSDIDGAAESYSEGAFRLVSATVISGNGSVTLETIDVTRDSASNTPENQQGNTGYLVYTPGANEPAQVEIQYTVEDANGNQSTATIFLNDTETVSVATDFGQLIEWGGRSATVTFTRTGPTTDPEWVDFSLAGTVDLVGSQNDVALAGFDSFDPLQLTGRVTIPAGHSTASLLFTALDDGLPEDAETLSVVIIDLESLLIQSAADTASITISEEGSIAVPILTEDVENNALDWINGSGQDANWLTGSGTTPSANTGPDNDHTKGDGSGTYLFVESSTPGYPSKQADLTGPTADLSALSSATLEFYYHMYGETMGDLFVDIYSGGVWNFDVGPTLSGQQQATTTAPWLLATVDVSAYRTDDFQIRFRGVTGSGFTSDMAIDDIIVGQSTLPNEAPVILGQPRSQTVLSGAPVYLSVVAEAYPAPAYQWQKDGVDLPGATRSVLSIETASFSDAGDYTCEVTSGSTVTSATATLTVALANDSDGDNLDDDWETFFFGDLTAGPSGDPDGDGDDNLTEFTNGTHPTVDEAVSPLGDSYTAYTATQLAGVGTDLNQGSATAIDWQPAANQDPLVSSHTGGLIKIQRAGDYFISLTLPMSSGVQRSAIRAQAYVNGSPVPGLLGESSYVRSSSGHDESSSHFAGLLSGLNTGDQLEVRVLGTAKTGTVTMSTARLFLERIQSARTVYAGLSDGTSSGDLNPASPEPLLWSAAQREDAGFTHTAGNAGITFDAAGAYFVTLNVPLNSTVQRAAPRAEFLLDGVRVAGGTAAQGYIRSLDNHENASLQWSGLVQATAGAVLTVTLFEEGSSGPVSLPTGEKASLFVEALDASSGVYFGSATALDSGDNWNVAGNLSFSSDLILDGTLYSKPIAHQVQVAATGDYLLVYNDALTSTDQRVNPKMTVRVNGVAVPGAETKSHYIRSNSGHNLSSGSLVTLLSLAAGDIVTVAVEAEAAGGTVDDDAAALFALIRKSELEGVADTDGDGMDDDWEIANFGDLSQGPNDDFDGDGDDNLTEFTNGTDPTVDTVAPAAPQNLSATVGDGEIALTWDANGESDLNSYRVYRSTTSGTGFTLLPTAVGTNSYTDTSVANETTYYYLVTAVDNSSNESSDSAEVSGTPVGGLLVSGDPRNGGLVYETYANEGQANAVHTVPDYSRAGYGGGGVEIPFVPAEVTLSPSGGDDTTAIQNAINTVSALPLVNGFRGAVLLTAGDYTVSSTLDINASGVVIRGQGQETTGGTRITYNATTQSDLFHVHGSSNPSYVGSSARDISDAFVPVGSFTVNVTDASPFAPGDFVRIRNKMNQQWIDDIGMTEAGGLDGEPDDPAWDPAIFQVSHYRYIVAVNGNELTFDAPITQTIEDQYGGGEVLKYTYTGAIENVGIENIRLESSFTADDDEDHGWEAIEIRRVKNGWVRQVTSRYFGMGLVLVDDFSQFITVEDSACLDPKSITTGGRKYSFNVDDSTYNLVQRTLSRGARHDYATGSLTPGPNVFVDGLAVQSNSDSGPHFRYATGELYDNIKTDTEINVQNRLNAGTSHGWAGAQIMFWNVDANSIISDAPTGGMNWSIGAVGTKSESPHWMSPWEPFGIWQSHNQHVSPRSLYYAQLEDRLDADALRSVILPEQEFGTVWSALQTWDGDGRFSDGVICWVAPDATLEVDTAINLSSRIRDLNILENLVSTTWSRASGPGTVVFGDSSVLATTATFDQQGTYVLQMTADDGSDQVLGSIELVIADPNFVAPPLAPANLVATANNGSVSLDWDDNAEADVTYTVKRSLISGSGFSAIEAGLTSSAYTDSAVTNGTTYFYVVTASVPGSNSSATSNQQSATPNAVPTFDAATIVEVGATEGQAYSSSLADNASDTDEDALTFSIVSGPAWLAVATDGALSGTPSGSDAGLNEWTVAVADGNGGTDQSTLQITVADVAPAGPSGLGASAGNNTVSLNWDDGGETDIASYTVYRSETSGSGYVAIATNLLTSDFTDSTATNGTTYYYVVTATDDGSNTSGFSAEVSATPEAPSTVLVSATDNAYIRASEVDTVHNVSQEFFAHRGDFRFGAREGYIRFPLTDDDEIGGVYVDSVGAVTLELYSNWASTHTVYVYALLDGVQFDATTLSESTWTGGTAGTEATGGNLTPNKRPLGLSAWLPEAGYTTALIGSIENLPANEVVQITITDTETFKQLIRDDTNGEITLLMNSNGQDNANSYASVFNTQGKQIPTLVVEQTDPPSAPTGLVATAGDGSVSLNWNDNAEPDLDHYIVYRSTTQGSGYTEIANPVVTSDYADSSAVNGTTYYYVVTAVDTNGNESLSGNEVTITIVSDSDGNGIDDAWEVEHFGEVGLIDGTVDSDGDGVIDFFEYLYGSIPTNSSSRGFHLTAEEDFLNSQVHFDWQTDPDFELETHYLIEVSTDLVNWNTLPTAHYTHSTYVVGDKLQNEVTIIHDYGTHVFVRLIAP